jgi:putative thiamine transport system permease protein
VGLLFVLPLLAALPLAVAQAMSPVAWAELFDDPHVPRALALSVRSALVSTALALGLALAFTTALHGSPGWQRLQSWLSPMLALPHAAFAIGVAWLVAPSGGLARLLAPLFGWTFPPDWSTVNDPDALLLTGVLVAKELPFLLWSVMALLARPEVAALLQRQIAVGRTLGYGRAALWWRVLWPQWLPRLAWPLLAVLAYGLTVVDLALIVGPASPPTLAMLAFADLMSGDVARNARGSAAALLLAGVLAGLVAAIWLASVLLGLAWRNAALDGRRRPVRAQTDRLAGRFATALAGFYMLVVFVLLALSVAGVWTFPAAWPQALTLDAWRQVTSSAGTLAGTAALAAAAALLALLLVVGWFEASPPRWDRHATPLVLAPLVLPPLLLMAGLYQAALALRLDGRWVGLLWVHVLVVLPYVFIALQPAWRSFDGRYEQASRALGRSRPAFWWHVKWPLLAAPLAAAAAVGFAVSVAQYLATQFIGAGRHATVTTEAVTLAAGGQRTQAAAFALLQAALPLLAFGVAGWLGRRRLAVVRA